MDLIILLFLSLSAILMTHFWPYTVQNGSRLAELKFQTIDPLKTYISKKTIFKITVIIPINCSFN